MRDSQSKQKGSQLQLYKKDQVWETALGENTYEVLLQNKSRECFSKVLKKHPARSEASDIWSFSSC